MNDKLFKITVPLLFLFTLTYIFACDVYVSSCQELNQSNTVYCLSSDIINSTNSNCFDVEAQYVTLDCQNYMIDGVDLSQSASALSTEQLRTTIQNCTLSDWGHGVNIAQYTNSLRAYNITIDSNRHGFYLNRCHGSCVLDNIAGNSGSDSGIFIVDYRSGYTDILNSEISGDKSINLWYTSSIEIENVDIDELYLFRARANTLRNSVVDKIVFESGSGEDAIYNNIYNNYFNNTEFEFIGGVKQNDWETSEQYGERIYTTGKLGGNFWVGYSESCTDADTDGFCDNSYTVNGTENVDNLPYSDECVSNWTLYSNETSCFNATTLLINETYQDENGCQYPYYQYSNESYINCPELYECSNGTCIYVSFCGDGFCDVGGGEDQDNCCTDCGCPFYHKCINNKCTETSADVIAGSGEEIARGITQASLPVGAMFLFFGIVLILGGAIWGGLKEQNR